MSTNTKKRCIMIFPKLNNINIINAIRDKYDPLSQNVLPHITLVFPFDSEISTSRLEEHVLESLKGKQSFDLTLQGVSKQDDFGFYLFLNIVKGNEIIKDLHDKLYTGLLKHYKPVWLTDFTPHMTIGHLSTKKELLYAYRDIKAMNDKFISHIDTISVEIIDENEDSILEIEVNLS